MKKIYPKILLIIMVFTIFINPINAYSKPEFDLNAQATVVYNLDSNVMIFQEQGDVRLKPASLTKIMTALIVINNVSDYDSTIVITSDMLAGLKEADASVMGLLEGEKISIRDLLYGLLLPSGADAANALAIYCSSKIDNFTNEMNRLVARMGLSDTNFTNPTGLEDPLMYTTANDMLEIFIYAMQFDIFKEIISTDSYTTKPTNAHPNGIVMHSSSKIKSKDNIYYSPFVKGGKTGFTYKAGRCFVSFGTTSNGLNYAIASLNAPISSMTNNSLAFSDQVKLYEWLDKNFEMRTVKAAGEKMGTYKIRYALDRKFEGVLSVDMNILFDNNMNENDLVFQTYTLDEYQASVLKNQYIGYVSVTDNDQIIGRFAINSSKHIKRNIVVKLGEDLIDFVVEYWINIIVASAIIYLIVLVLVIRSRNKKQKAKKQTEIKNRLAKIKRDEEKAKADKLNGIDKIE